MTRTRSLASGLLSLSAAAVLAVTAAGGASAAPSASGDEENPIVASVAVESAGVAAYWTPDRMRNAISGEVLAGKALERSNRASTPIVEKAKTKKTEGSVSKAISPTSVKHIGKIFFTMGTSNYVCSGNAVESNNKSTVATAGHCAVGGPDQKATNFIFVPAYENGSTPYGTWTAKELYTPTEWSTAGNISFDTAFAVMNPNDDGESLTDVVGASKVAFGEARGLNYTIYGYPADKQFNGLTLKSCAGTATNDTTNTKFTTQGIPCDMNGGASGGPWFIGSGPDGVQNSINSYGYSGSKVMYGPYWGPEIEATYGLAQAS
jgi:V8-like Glu-specific endopeptidase